MRLIKRDDLAKGVKARWYETYWCKRTNTWKYDDGKRVIYENLKALGSNPSADFVDEVIGNTSWTACRCDECEGQFDAVIEVGQEPDYESSTAKLCEGCVQYALGVFDEDRSKQDLQ